MKSNEVSLREKIAYVQHRAYTQQGIHPSVVKAHFQQEAERLKRFQIDRPRYLPDAQALSELDPSVSWISVDLEERARRAQLTPYQDPMLHSWLSDVWRLHCQSLYGDAEPWDMRTEVATAPTGEFNAMAICANDGNAIMLDDGLPNFAMSISRLLSPILYDRDPKGHTRREPTTFGIFDAFEIGLVDNAAQLIVDYVVDGKAPQNEPSTEDYDPDGSLHYLVFNGFVSFVMEHELHHLGRANGHIDIDETARVRGFNEAWKMMDAHFSEHFPIHENKELLRQRYIAHHEEIEADIRGITTTILKGERQSVMSPTIDGALLFFHLAHLVRITVLSMLDPEEFEAEKLLDGRFLSIFGFMSGQSHPYPIVRKAGVFMALKASTPRYFELVVHCEKRLQIIATKIWESVQQKLVELPEDTLPNTKWNRDFASLL